MRVRRQQERRGKVRVGRKKARRVRRQRHGDERPKKEMRKPGGSKKN